MKNNLKCVCDTDFSDKPSFVTAVSIHFLKGQLRFNVNIQCMHISTVLGESHKKHSPPGSPGTGSSRMPLSVTPSFSLSFPRDPWDLGQRDRQAHRHTHTYTVNSLIGPTGHLL